MAYLAAPAINWGGNAPQSQGAVVSQSTLIPVVVPLVNGVIASPNSFSLVNTTTGHSI